MKITAQDITGVVGIVPTPATPNADRWDAEHTVDLAETAKMIEGVVEAGTSIVMTTGTFGEGATLLWDEMRDFVDCVVQTTAHRRPVFAGVTTLGTRETIARARALMDLGADGIFTGRPMWVALDTPGVVRYYRDLAEALPGVPLVVYDNPTAFKGPISLEAYEELAKIPQIVAAKQATRPELPAIIERVGAAMRILPSEGRWFALAEQYPDLVTACWSGGVACGPATINALAHAIAARDWPAAQIIADKIKWAAAPMRESGGGSFDDYSIQLGHVRFAAAGFIKPGPTRVPYVEAPEELIAGSIECGRRWGTLQSEFASVDQRRFRGVPVLD
jgi:4-(2-carboxyphenyl)-2-oxobut-3-enoate aldolase